MTAPARLLVGRVAKAHGIRGEVAVEVVSQAPGRFEPGSTMLHRDATLTVEAVRPHQGRLLVKFEEVPDRTAAEALRGARLEIEGAEAAELDEGSFYPWELEGFAVEHVSGEALGTLVRVEEYPANDLWVVDAGGREVLVPAVSAIVTSVDVDTRRIVIDPPEGLF